MKLYIISLVSFFFGNLLGILPFGVLELVIKKGVDTGYIGGILMLIIGSGLITVMYIFFDALIIRFLLKLHLKSITYFLLGITLGVIIGIFILI